jgi:GNAT superfamily N-acetyltransferase
LLIRIDSYIGFVLPDYRQQGIADMLLVEECRRADELGLEAYMEAVTAMGVPIFMRHGFIPFKKVTVEPKTENPNEEWNDMETKMQPLRFWPMWRPAYGKFTPGVTIPPWKDFMSGMFSKL